MICLKYSLSLILVSFTFLYGISSVFLWNILKLSVLSSVQFDHFIIVTTLICNTQFLVLMDFYSCERFHSTRIYFLSFIAFGRLLPIKSKEMSIQFNYVIGFYFVSEKLLIFKWFSLHFFLILFCYNLPSTKWLYWWRLNLKLYNFIMKLWLMHIMGCMFIVHALFTYADIMVRN